MVQTSIFYSLTRRAYSRAYGPAIGHTRSHGYSACARFFGDASLNEQTRRTATRLRGSYGVAGRGEVFYERLHNTAPLIGQLATRRYNC